MLNFLKHLKSLAEKLAPIGYEDETGFHFGQDNCEESSALHERPRGVGEQRNRTKRCPPIRRRKGSNGKSACFRA